MTGAPARWPIGRPWLCEIKNRDGESVKVAWFKTQYEADKWGRREAMDRPMHTVEVKRQISENQMTLLGEDPPGQAELDAALTQVDDNADDEWKQRADAAYLLAAARYHEFTNDAIWAILEGEWHTPPPHERRALGTRARAAMKAGVMEPTGRYVPSQRPATHRNPIMVYRSLRQRT